MTAIIAIIVGLSIGNQWAVGTGYQARQASSAEAIEFARARCATAATPRVPWACCRHWCGAGACFRKMHLAGITRPLRRAELWNAALRFTRNTQLIVMLVVGVLLYLNQQINAGAVFGVIYISMRAVSRSPAVTSSWRSIWNAITAAERIILVLSSENRSEERMELPRPRGSLMVSRAVVARRIQNRSSWVMSRSRCKAADSRRGRAKRRRQIVPRQAAGRRVAAPARQRDTSIATIWRIGTKTSLGGTSAMSRRKSNCCRERWRRISRGSMTTGRWITKPFSTQRGLAGIEDIIRDLRQAITRGSAWTGTSSPAVNASAWRWRVPCTATRRCWCWTSRIPISTLLVSKRLAAP